VDREVHLRHAHGLAGLLLPVDRQLVAGRAAVTLNEVRRMHEHPARPARRIEYPPVERLDDLHDQPDDRHRREELARALPLSERERGSSKRYVYTYQSKKAVMAIKAKVRVLTHRSAFPTLAALLSRVNSTLRGWAAYFQHGVSKRTLSAIGVFAWRRVVRWLRKRHRRASLARLLRRYLPGWVPTEDGVTLFNPVTVPVTRYRYRGAKIPNPWTTTLPTACTA
jgi:hypothetical protein